MHRNTWSRLAITNALYVRTPLKRIIHASIPVVAIKTLNCHSQVMYSIEPAQKGTKHAIILPSAPADSVHYF
jgi:hypothetical protein